MNSYEPRHSLPESDPSYWARFADATIDERVNPHTPRHSADHREQVTA